MVDDPCLIFEVKEYESERRQHRKQEGVEERSKRGRNPERSR